MGTGSDVRRVLVQSDVLVAARTLEYLHLRSDVSSFPVSSSQFLYTSTCFPCCYQKSVPTSEGLLHPATALHRQHDIRTLSLPSLVSSLRLFRSVGLLIVFGMGFLLESGGTFYEVRARDRSEEFPMRKVQYACREKAAMNTFEARV